MALDFSLLKPIEAPSMMDSMGRAANLSQIAMQSGRMAGQMQSEQADAAAKAKARRVSAWGNALDGLASVKPEQRDSAYTQMRQQLITDGHAKPDELPEQRDDGLLGNMYSRWKQTPEYLEKRKTMAEIAKLQAEARTKNATSATLTPGQEMADKEFGKEAADYYYGGGKSGVEKNMGKLEGAIQTLNDNPDLTGGWSTRVPIIGSDAAQDSINPQMAAVRDDIRGAIQGTLKQVLGGQYTEKEGEAIFNRAFNPRLSAAENVKRAQAELQALQSMAAAKDKSMGQFLASGTLKGYRPGQTNLAGNDRMVPVTPPGGGGGLIPEVYANERETPKAPPKRPAVNVGAIVNIGGKHYRVGADGDTLEPIKGKQ